MGLCTCHFLIISKWKLCTVGVNQFFTSMASKGYKFHFCCPKIDHLETDYHMTVQQSQKHNFSVFLAVS